MKSRRLSVIAAVIGAGHVACTGSSLVTPGAEDQLGRVQATVHGALETNFEGTGSFVSDSDPRVGLSAKFQFDSRGIGSSEGESINAVWFEGGIPPIGLYELVRYTSTPQGFSLFYHRDRDGRREDYSVVNGTIEITMSSPDRVAGHFQGEALLSCSVPARGLPSEEDWCYDDPSEPIPVLPRISLSGTFELLPWDGSVSPL